MRTSFFLFLFAVVVMAGCKSSSTSTNGSTSSSIVTPGDGSYFVLNHQTFDSTGAVSISYIDTEEVYSNTLSMFGKNNVLELLAGLDFVIPVVEYVNYDSNGDVTSDSSVADEVPVSIVEAGIFFSRITYPFASQKTTTLSGIDSQNQLTLAGAGSGTITINNQAIPIQKVNATPSGPSTFPETVTLSFAPSLGVIVERTALSGGVETYHDIVTNYVLKP